LSDSWVAASAAARGLWDGRECELTQWLPSGAPERLKVDEFRRKSQYYSTMKSLSVLLVFILTAISVVAQTDTNTVVGPADTNAPGSHAVVTQTDTNTMAATAPAREMSLEDCIQEALQHNLDLQIERYSP